MAIGEEFKKHIDKAKFELQEAQRLLEGKDWEKSWHAIENAIETLDTISICLPS